MTDSHDTNLPLEEGKLEAENIAPEAAEAPAPTPSEETAVETDQAAQAPKASTKEEIINRLRELAADPDKAEKAETDSLKQQFYKFLHAEQEAARAAFVETGGAPADFRPQPDALEETFKTLSASIRQARAARAEALEQEKEKNLAAKLAIIDRLKELVANPDDANRAYDEYKQLQQQWNAIKLVPASAVADLWKNYQLYAEQFYDLIKLNNEFREYDFKKNLDAKTRLCEAAERLAEEPDVVSAFRQLQQLHQEYRETGPVAKEQREAIWARFKAASTAVNRRHQQHFEALKAQEQQNLDAKTAICEIIEAIDLDSLTTFSAWDEKTQEVLALQAKWRTIGFAPQKSNLKIFERFRAAADRFFQRKSAFYKATKETQAANLEKKRALVEQAEALKDSTEWRATADTLTRLQQEWKAIGSTPKRQADSLWKRFIGACDYFFEQRGKATSSVRNEEAENLGKKKAIIQRLKELDENDEAEASREDIKAIMQEWNAIGHVPFKEKDKVYKQYRDLLDRIFDRLHLSQADRRLNNFRNSIGTNGASGKGDNLHRERERLVRAYEGLKSEIQTYENNLGFLNASSKKGNSLVSEVMRNIERLKGELALIQQKIDVVDQSIADAQEA